MEPVDSTLVDPILTFKTPVSTANLGPGYGVLGLAVDLSLEVSIFSRDDGDLVVDRRDEPDASSLDPRHDTVLRGLRGAAELLDLDTAKGLTVVVEGRAPRGCGLGTNSAGYAAGIGAAARLAKKTLEPWRLLDLMYELGGDPGHGAASLVGGLVASCLVSPASDPASYRLVPKPIREDWQLVFVMPAVQMGTAQTKRVLPATLPHAVTQRTCGRLFGLTHALATGDEELLGQSLVDEVHVPYRRNLVPGLEQALAAGTDAGAAGATLSGHGPGVVAFTTDCSKTEAIGTAMADAFQAAGLESTRLTLQTCPTGSLTGI